VLEVYYACCTYMYENNYMHKIISTKMNEK
jgi:hypothetical protein